MSDKCKGNRLCMSRDAHEALHEQLAAKDAEIAELRAALQRANDTIRSQNRLAHGAATETSRAERERDEARECVGRLYKFVRFMHEIYPDPIKGGCASVIAATPKHLR